MTKHQYLHLTHQITQLHTDMKWDFVIVLALMTLLFLCGLVNRS